MKASNPESELILCVDDDSINLSLLSATLVKAGYEVATAASGQAALEQVEALSPCAVLLDWQMPKLSGIETLRLLRARHDAMDLPVIMVTALRGEAQVVEAFECGANDYVAKPVEVAILLARLRAHLRLRRLSRERVRLLEELERLARADALTGVYNRRGFDDFGQGQVSHARRHKLPLSVVLFDVDHFKEVNDSYGHAVGDEALRTIAKVLDRSRRKEDLLARIGGEEFAVICPSTSAQDAAVVAERCCAAMRETPIEGMPKDRRVTLSAGVAQLSPGHHGFADLLGDSDRWMYRAKEQGRDRVCIAPTVGSVSAAG